MREDLTSSSFLAVIVVGLSVVCAGLIVLGFWSRQAQHSRSSTWGVMLTAASS